MSDIRRGDRLGEFVCEAPLWSVAGGQWWRVRHGALPDVEAAALVAAPEGPLAPRLAGLARSQDGLPAERLLGVRGIDTGATPPYLVLDLPEGEWLRERLARGPCSSAEARLIVVGVADALSALHDAGTAFGGVAVEDVHLGNGARVRLGLAGAPVRAAAGAVAATRADDLRSLASFTFALLTGTVPAGVLGPNDTTGLPDWAKRVVAKAQGLDGGYAEAAEVRADLETMVRAA
ncbi:MAG: protein kinase family protein, partial [Planctomycetota bacterium]